MCVEFNSTSELVYVSSLPPPSSSIYLQDLDILYVFVKCKIEFIYLLSLLQYPRVGSF